MYKVKCDHVPEDL